MSLRSNFLANFIEIKKKLARSNNLTIRSVVLSSPTAPTSFIILRNNLQNDQLIWKRFLAQTVIKLSIFKFLKVKLIFVFA